jgi:hypothetical protein
MASLLASTEGGALAAPAAAGGAIQHRFSPYVSAPRGRGGEAARAGTVAAGPAQAPARRGPRARGPRGKDGPREGAEECARKSAHGEGGEGRTQVRVR